MNKKSIYKFGPEDRSLEGQAIGAIINNRLCFPILKELFLLNNNDFTTNQTIVNKLNSKVNLEEADLQQHGRGNEFEYRIKWALNHLKNTAFVEKDSKKNMSWKICKDGILFIQNNGLDKVDEIDETLYIKLTKDFNDLLKNSKNSIDPLKFADLVESLKIKFHEKNNEFYIIDKYVANHFAWIGDTKYIKGTDLVHYEIGTRHPGGDVIYVDIHFEGKKKKDKDQFYNALKDIQLPNKLNWLDWHNSNSITYKEKFDIDDEAIVEELYEALDYLHSNIANKIISVIKKSDIEDNSGSSSYGNPNIQLNQILYGPPGTGKTYNTINKAISIINPDFDLNQDRNIIKSEFDRLQKEGQIVFTTFHQSMSYEDFIEGIKPITIDHKVLYNIENGIFKNLSQEANKKSISNFNGTYDLFINDLKERNDNDGYLEIKTKTGKSLWIKANKNNNINIYTTADKNFQGSMTKEKLKSFAEGYNSFMGWEGYAEGILQKIAETHSLSLDLTVDNSKKKYVLVIDEINRGNVSAIFGELITLIEEDKRLGRKEGLEVVLPYSKDRFGVPANLYIIGTMNTADRSIEALDTALRRRFSFSEMMPKPELVANIKFQGFNLAEVLTTINERIEVLLDRDHAIGHSYFLKVKSGDTIGLKSVFKNNILPLLQEYFYHDYEKIALILGEGFIRINEKKTLQFANFKNIETPEINMQFEVIRDINNIETAVQSLLNRNA